MADDFIVNSGSMDRLAAFVGKTEGNTPDYGDEVYNLQSSWSLTEAIARLTKASESKLNMTSATATGSLPVLTFASDSTQNALVIAQIQRSTSFSGTIDDWGYASISPPWAPAQSQVSVTGDILDYRVVPITHVGTYSVPVSFSGYHPAATDYTDVDLLHNEAIIDSVEINHITSNILLMSTVRLTKGLQRLYFDGDVIADDASIHVLGLQPFTFTPEAL